MESVKSSPANPQPLPIFLEIAQLYILTLKEMFRFPWRWDEIIRASVDIALGSLPIIAISTTFAGLVVTHEIAWHMKEALQTTSMIPGFTGQFILRELGVAVPALLLVSKVGASIAAEVSSMKVTEQLDALRLLRIRTISYLVFPRWVATVLALVCLTLISIGITLICAMGVAVYQYGFGTYEYINMFRRFVGLDDLIGAIVKSTVFGTVIPIVSCVYGFRCAGGAQGVGNATTQSVVTSTLLVISLDFLLTYLLGLIF